MLKDMKPTQLRKEPTLVSAQHAHKLAWVHLSPKMLSQDGAMRPERQDTMIASSQDP